MLRVTGVEKETQLSQRTKHAQPGQPVGQEQVHSKTSAESATNLSLDTPRRQFRVFSRSSAKIEPRCRPRYTEIALPSPSHTSHKHTSQKIENNTIWAPEPKRMSRHNWTASLAPRTTKRSRGPPNQRSTPTTYNHNPKTLPLVNGNTHRKSDQQPTAWGSWQQSRCIQAKSNWP